MRTNIEDHTWQRTPDALPQPVMEWLLGIRSVKAGANRFFSRAQRFADYWHQGAVEAQDLERAWGKIEAAALDHDALIGLFGTMPDAPVVEPLAGIYGRRNIDAGEERWRNSEMRKHIANIREALAFRSLKNYAGDAQATGDTAVLAYQALAAAVTRLRSDLAAFDHMLELIDPGAKVGSGHYASSRLAETNYRNAVAGLNHYLHTPEHAALAFLASVNYPALQVPRNTIQMIWNRREDNERKSKS